MIPVPVGQEQRLGRLGDPRSIQIPGTPFEPESMVVCPLIVSGDATLLQEYKPYLKALAKLRATCCEPDGILATLKRRNP